MVKPGIEIGSVASQLQTNWSNFKSNLNRFVAATSLKPIPPEDPNWNQLVSTAMQIEQTLQSLAADHPNLGLENVRVMSGIIGNLATSSGAQAAWVETGSTGQQRPMSAILPTGASPASNSQLSLELAQAVANAEQLIEGLAAGKVPVWKKSLFGRVSLGQMIAPIKKVVPRLFVIEDIEIASFLGDYGAGRTVRTFSLLPGEKTVISVRSWRNEAELAKRTENVLDSYSESSANTLEGQVQRELASSSQAQDSDTWGFSNLHQEAHADSSSWSAGGGASFDCGLFSVGGGGGYSAASSSSSSDQNQNFECASTNRETAVSSVDKAMDRHVNQSAASRKHDVNTETTQTESKQEGVEQSIVRTLENVNGSRVLNFVFRALNQEYVTLTYLKDVAFGFTQCIPGDGKCAGLDGLEGFLKSYLRPDRVGTIRDPEPPQECTRPKRNPSSLRGASGSGRRSGGRWADDWQVLAEEF